MARIINKYLEELLEMDKISLEDAAAILAYYIRGRFERDGRELFYFNQLGLALLFAKVLTRCGGDHWTVSNLGDGDWTVETLDIDKAI